MVKRIVVAVILFSGFVFAQSAEKTGLTFLKVGYGARNIAIGDLGVVIADGATAGFYNPALLKVDSYEASFTHSNVLQDVSSEMFGATFTAFSLPFAIGINTTSISDIEIRTKPGEAEGTFNANYFYGSLSTAININENIAVGASGKYLYENLFSDDATGWGLDLGISVKKIVSNLDLGLSVNNLGSMNKLRDEETKLPSSASFGASYLVDLDQFDFLFASGFKRYLSAESNHFQAGTEITYSDMLHLRVGYISGIESKDMSYGLGVEWGSFSFDYAYMPVDFGLGNSSYLTIIYTF